jgi:hypothetical protein
MNTRIFLNRITEFIRLLVAKIEKNVFQLLFLFIFFLIKSTNFITIKTNKI